MKSNVKKSIIAAFILIGVLVNWVTFAEALEPRLLWQKTLPFEIGDLRMAYESGDLMISSREARQIILLDRDGNKRFHWGPRLDRQPMGIDISDDGNTIIYVTTWTESYLERKKTMTTWDKRIHYSTKNGKELWNRSISGMPVLSPDGKMIAIGPSAGEGTDLAAIDSQGKTLWKYISREAMDIIFSSDSNYLIFYGENGLHLLDKTGNLLWIKEDMEGRLTKGAAYIVTNRRVYDRQGRIVMDISGNKTSISDNGNKAIFVYPNKISLLNWPDKAVLREYPFTVLGGRRLSGDGRFLAISGTFPSSSNNLYIFDTLTDASWETMINPHFYFLLSRNGKYLVAVVVNMKKLLYYQVY